MHLLKQSFLCAGLITLLATGCAKPKPEPSTIPAPTSTKAVPAAAAAAVEAEPGSRSLFDGKTLTGWVSTDFSGRGEVTVKDGQINLGEGYMTGVNWTGAVPKMNYEISLDAKRVEGSDFFCGLTFPVGPEFCSLIVGGWGGGTVGLSSVNGEDASSNETTSSMNFVTGKWYHIRVRVTPGKIDAWIDDEQVVKLATEEKNLSIRLEVEVSKPLGIATWHTAAALKNIQITTLK